MTNNIKTISLEKFSENSDNTGNPQFYLSSRNVNKISPNVPYRSDYFFVSICLKGRATLKANLDQFEVKENSLITMSAQVIKEWKIVSDDYEKLTILFTKDFLLDTNINPNFLDELPFFELNRNHITDLTIPDKNSIVELFEQIERVNNSNHVYKFQKIQHLIHLLLLEISGIYSPIIEPQTKNLSRPEQLTHDFKELVSKNFTKERGLKFYAEQLFVTPKHLTETIKEQTGKTAGDWIYEMVILEAKILLQSPTLNIANITEILNFSDQSIFGKFFKNLTGVSPLHYKKSI